MKYLMYFFSCWPRSCRHHSLMLFLHRCSRPYLSCTCVLPAFFVSPKLQTGITKLDDANHAGTARSQVRVNFLRPHLVVCSSGRNVRGLAKKAETFPGG